MDYRCAACTWTVGALLAHAGRNMCMIGRLNADDIGRTDTQSWIRGSSSGIDAPACMQRSSRAVAGMQMDLSVGAAGRLLQDNLAHWMLLSAMLVLSRIGTQQKSAAGTTTA